MDEVIPRSQQMESLPQDVLCNIFSRLPLKKVIQCSSLCKSWLSIIRDPSFGNLHFSRSESESEPMLLVLTYDKIDRLKVISMSYLKLEDMTCQTVIYNMTTLRSWRLVGTCNGLLCFATSDRKGIVMICNPVTREHIILPKATPPPECCKVVLGFGFDQIAMKYKVVRIFCSHGTAILAEVCALGDTGSWRKVEGVDCSSIGCAPDGRSVYANGAVHWLDRKAEIILSFDLGREEFTAMTYPMRSGDWSIFQKLATERWILSAVGTSERFPRVSALSITNGAFGVVFGYSDEDSKDREIKTARRSLQRFEDMDMCSIHKASLVSLRHLNADVEDDYGCDIHFVDDINCFYEE